MNQSKISPKQSLRAPWKVDNALVDKGNAVWTTLKSGCLCPCQYCWQWPPAKKKKTGRGSLLDCPSRTPNDQIRRGTEPTRTVNDSLIKHHLSVKTAFMRLFFISSVQSLDWQRLGRWSPWGTIQQSLFCRRPSWAVPQMNPSSKTTPLSKVNFIFLCKWATHHLLFYCSLSCPFVHVNGPLTKKTPSLSSWPFVV